MYTEWIRQLAVGDMEEEAVDPAQAIEDQMLSRQKGLLAATASGNSPIQRYYENATIFLTGGSGFLGKQLIEKLFRSCNIKKMYLLMRPKKGIQAQERLKEILEDPVYSMLVQQKPDFASRIVCVPGDVAAIRLGLSQLDWDTVTKEADMIFHVAATTRFDESLRVAALINVRGTREALALARECQHLRSFVYVSTAYSHATADKIGGPVYEQYYPSPLPPDTLVRMAESMPPGVLDHLTPRLTLGWPNTYTFAKAVAEEQVRLTAAGLPLAIVRPSIVISAHHEPAPGWLDVSAARSASGFVVGSGLGLIHVMQTTPSTDLSLVPVDYVNNAILAAGWEVGVGRSDASDEGESETKIYNVVMSQKNKLTWETLRGYYMSLRSELAMPSAVYLAYVFCVHSYPLFLLLTVFLHIIPAYAVDLMLAVVGRERRFVKIYKKIFKLSVSLSYFLNTTYYLDGTNTEKLYDKLSALDQQIFHFNMRKIDWFEFCKVWCIGVRKYLVKDGLRNTDVGKRKQFWFQYVNYVILSLYICVIWFVVGGVFKVFWRVCFTGFV